MAVVAAGGVLLAAHRGQGVFATDWFESHG